MPLIIMAPPCLRNLMLHRLHMVNMNYFRLVWRRKSARIKVCLRLRPLFLLRRFQVRTNMPVSFLITDNRGFFMLDGLVLNRVTMSVDKASLVCVCETCLHRRVGLFLQL